MTRPRVRSVRHALVPALAALGLAALLGGCVVAPAYPDYGYGYGAPGYAPGYVVVGSGWGWHGGWHDGGYWHR
jgi:hypothetical protein